MENVTVFASAGFVLFLTKILLNSDSWLFLHTMQKRPYGAGQTPCCVPDRGVSLLGPLTTMGGSFLDKNLKQSY